MTFAQRARLDAVAKLDKIQELLNEAAVDFSNAVKEGKINQVGYEELVHFAHRCQTMQLYLIGEANFFDGKPHRAKELSL